MPGEASTVGANNALDAITGRVTQTARTTYLALLTTAPTDATTVATMVELSGSGYSRQSVTWGAPTGDPSVTANTNAITFGPFGFDPANVVAVALVSSASGTTGDFLYSWTASKDVGLGDAITIAVGALTASLD